MCTLLIHVLSSLLRSVHAVSVMLIPGDWYSQIPISHQAEQVYISLCISC